MIKKRRTAFKLSKKIFKKRTRKTKKNNKSIKQKGCWNKSKTVPKIFPKKPLQRPKMKGGFWGGSARVYSTQCNNRKFEFRIQYPNSYYIGLGSLYVPPHVHFKVCEESHWEGGTGGVRFMIPGPNNSNPAPGESINEDINNKVQDVINSNEFHTIQIDEGIPFRTLTYPSPPSKNPRTSPMFYHCGKNQLPIRGQEQVLRDSGYPEVNKMPNNFWGLKPPL